MIGESLPSSEQSNVEKVKEEERLIEKRWEVSNSYQKGASVFERSQYPRRNL